MEEHGSEVARLLQQIREEYESAEQGLTGLAQGTIQHRFITKKMENLGRLHKELKAVAGEGAMALIAATLEQPPQEEQAQQ